jgi:protein-disulfide isomerase/FKBP-type peptidyl-prolyl cis-trans isomerase
MPSLVRFVPRLVLSVAFTACVASPPPAAPSAEARVISTGPAPAAPAPPPSEDLAVVPITQGDPTWGSRSAPITIVVFADFQCPFCAKLVPTLAELQTTYGPEKLRVVWKNLPLPFHQNAQPAAEAAMGVFALRGSDAFWRFHDVAFKNQSALSEASYGEWGAAVGVDAATLAAGLADHRWKAKVDEDHALATRLGVSGTPAALVNGILVSGAQPVAKFKEVIEPELTKANDLARSGMPPDRVYLARAEANYSRPAPKAPKADEKDDTTTVYKVPVGRSPVRGKTTALVTIVEFADFQCPYCKRVEPTLEQVQATYGDQVRIVWKDEPLPFHPRAEPALELAREARAEQGDAGFWRAHDALFQSQPKLEDADLDAVAASVGLDVAKVQRAISQHTHKAAAAGDQDLADDVQATGTPHFFINGRRLVGAQPFDKFKSIIDAEILHSNMLLRDGATMAGLYDQIIRDGKGPAPLDTKTLALPTNAPSRGNPGAQVVIQEVSDFQCPFCKRSQDTLKEVMALYGTKVRLVWRNNPLPMHADAALAAEAALEAFAQQGSPGFWKMHDLLFANQPAGSTQDGLKRAALDGYAAQLGLDMGKWAAALDGRTHRAAVEVDARAANDAGITGTPGFVIGGYFINGAQPVAKFRKVIDEVLAHGPAKTHPASTVAIHSAGTRGAPGGTRVTASGLTINDKFVGTGATVKGGDHVSVHYTGTLMDGTVFDSSRTRGQPFDFVVGTHQVIKGWEEGLVGMKVGGSRTLTIPPDLGYGSRGAGGKIPPDATLIFDIELLGIQ